jgi:hypothetical protein
MDRRDQQMRSFILSVMLTSAFFAGGMVQVIAAGAGSALARIPEALESAGRAGARGLALAQAGPTPASFATGPLDRGRLSKLLGLPAN